MAASFGDVLSALMRLVNEGDDTDRVLELETTGANSAVTKLFVGSRDPIGAVSGDPGNMYLRVEGANSRLYVHTGTATSSSDWNELAAAQVTQLLAPVRNETGGLLSKGKLVVATGYSVSEGRPTIELADKDDPALRPALGFLSADLADATNGQVIIIGSLIGVDTSSFSVTDQLVLGDAGDPTRPPPDNASFTGEVQSVGSVVRVDAVNGEIAVAIGGLNPVTGDQVFALAGTSGSPSDSNRFVTDQDHRVNFESISPAAIASQQDDYNPSGWATADLVLLTLTGDQSISGFAAVTAADMPRKIVVNIDDTDYLTLLDEDASSTAANRLAPSGDPNLGTGLAPLLLGPREACAIEYDFAASRWRVVAQSRDTQMHSTKFNSATHSVFGTYNDFNPTGWSDADVLFLDDDNSTWTITGFEADVRVKRKAIINVRSPSITLTHDDAASTAGNRIYCPLQTDIILGRYECAVIEYVENDDHWRVISLSETKTILSITDALVADQNDYSPTGWETCDLLRLSMAADRTITGFAQLGSHNSKFVQNDGPGTLTLTYQDLASSAGNRIRTPTGADLKVPAGWGVELAFDTLQLHWYVVSMVGDVVGPNGATDNAIPRFDGATGKLLQGSLLLITDTGELDLTGHEVRNRAFNTLSPAAIAAQQDDYSPAGWANAERVRLDLTGDQTITGFLAVAPTAGAVLKVVHNTDAVDTLRVNHESASSAAANRVICPDGADLYIRPYGSFAMLYDPTSSRWRVVSVARPSASILLFEGGASFAGGDVTKHHTVQGAVDNNTGRSATLDQTNQKVLPFAGVFTYITWNTATADATTVYKINVDGAVVETVALTGASGVLALTSSFASGAKVAVEYDAGTAPGESQVQLYGRRTE